MSKLVGIFTEYYGSVRGAYRLEIPDQTEITKENTEKLEDLAAVSLDSRRYPYKKVAVWICE